MAQLLELPRAGGLEAIAGDVALLAGREAPICLAHNARAIRSRAIVGRPPRDASHVITPMSNVIDETAIED